MSPELFRRRVIAAMLRWNMLPVLDAGVTLRLGIAVSGGADSVALLHTFRHLADEANWELVVLHVNHQLRGHKSDEDARFVGSLAASLNVPCQVANFPLSGAENMEAEARALRYSWFRERRSALNLHRIALGHTRSDQAETVLFRFLRGAGTPGLSGIRPTNDAGFIRPFLALTRDDVHSQLAPGAWREDSSNRNLTFDRNRIRHQLLPELHNSWNPQIENALAHVADWAQAEEEYWAPVIAATAAQLVQPSGVHNPAQLCPTGPLNALPAAVARRLIRHIVERVRGDLRGVEFAHIEEIRALAARTEGSGRLQIPGVDIMRSFDWLRFAPPGAYAGDRRFSAVVQIPGEIVLPESDSRLVLQELPQNCRYTDLVGCLDGDRIPGSLELRTWQPGDRFQALGDSSEVKLKSRFQEARIPLWERRAWPVLAASESIVWTRRFGVAAGFAAGPGTRRVISIEEKLSGAPAD